MFAFEKTLFLSWRGEEKQDILQEMFSKRICKAVLNKIVSENFYLSNRIEHFVAIKVLSCKLETSFPEGAER